MFAEKLAVEGFAFLDARIREHGGTGLVLTCQRDGRIAGAIGPMEIMPDSRGAARLLPQYFGVLPAYRGLGLGRSLWQAAMRWGQQHQAAYQLLQTQTGGASDRLCRSEGLTDLGLVCTSTRAHPRRRSTAADRRHAAPVTPGMAGRHRGPQLRRRAPRRGRRLARAGPRREGHRPGPAVRAAALAMGVPVRSRQAGRVPGAGRGQADSPRRRAGRVHRVPVSRAALPQAARRHHARSRARRPARRRGPRDSDRIDESFRLEPTRSSPAPSLTSAAP